ncbi:MAG: acetyl-CoA acetyltransferase [Polyangiaceae bacterium]
MTPVFVLGGAQTDFARNWSREGLGIVDVLGSAVQGAIDDALLEPSDIQSAHVGNFCGELFTGQGQLGGALSIAVPGLYGVPAARHEAACASGGVAILAASAEIEAGRYDCVLVAGVEVERNVSGLDAARRLGSAAWVGHDALEAKYPWPYTFSEIAREYHRRYGLRYEHLAAISKINIENARNNPLAQTRAWRYTDASFTENDEANPIVEGWLRRQDCGQVTDGAAAVILASASFAEQWARHRKQSLESLPRILGWGHRTVHLGFEEKLRRSAHEPHVFPHVRQAIQDAFRRACLADVREVDGIETHDCFSMSEYMAIDHFGLTAPGESWRAIESGEITRGGKLPINPSGGLIGVGHPVGATGVRMVHDAARQVRGSAGDTQVEGARRFATLNIGGSTTTTVAFVIGA